MGHKPDGSYTVETIGDCLESRIAVFAHCSACQHSARVDLLAVSIARGLGLLIEELWTLLRCKACRSRRVTITLVTGGTEGMDPEIGKG